MTICDLACAETPTKSDLTTAASAPADAGCSLIPFPDKRQTCVSANAGLHGREACDAAGRCDTLAVKTALQLCVSKRTASNGAFQSTITELERLKSNVWKGNNPANKAMKKLADTIVERIRPGQPNHADELVKAQTRLRACTI
jgi:hypothetical protein